MKSFRERRPWLVGVTSIVLLAALVWFAFSINRFDSLRGVYRISADLKDAAGLQPGNEVRVAGVKVGSVTDIALTPGAARVEMEIERDIHVPVETVVEVKLKTLLGQKFIELQMPRSYLTAASRGEDPSLGTEGFLDPGDVIPKSQTRIPFEIYQAATKGTETLAAIDKGSLRKLINVLGGTFIRSKDEIRRALVSLEKAGVVLEDKGPRIATLLRNVNRVSGTLALSDEDIEGILIRATEVLGVLEARRETISSLLIATEDFSANLALLIRASSGSVEVGVRDLNSILILAQGEMKTITAALDELAVAQRMFAAPGGIGKFIEGHVCAITTEDTCVPSGSPSNPGVPVKGQQPSPAPALQEVDP